MLCGFFPNRRPNRSMSQVPGSAQEVNSSHQAFSCCGPRRRSASSAEYIIAVAPFGHSTLRFELRYTGMFHGGLHARMPDSPSTIVSRMSAAVGATRAILDIPCSSTCSRHHSAPDRVLPDPRPARNNHVLQLSSNRSPACRGSFCQF